MDYDILIAGRGATRGEIIVLDGIYNRCQTPEGDVRVMPQARFLTAAPGCIQLMDNGYTITIEGGEFTVTGNRSACILFGEDPYWNIERSEKGKTEHQYADRVSGTVVFTGVNASFESTVTDNTSAVGIAAKNLNVQFSEDAVGCSGIHFVLRDGVQAVNMAYGMYADEKLAVDGDMGASIVSYLDCSKMTKEKTATTAGLIVDDGTLTVNGDILGDILCYSMSSEDAYAYGIKGGDETDVTVNGEIVGTVAALAACKHNFDEDFYVEVCGVYGNKLDVTVSGVMIAGAVSSSMSVDEIKALTLDTTNNHEILCGMTDKYCGIFGNADSQVTLNKRAEIYGNVELYDGNSTLTITDNATVYGKVNLYCGANGTISYILNESSGSTLVSGAVTVDKATVDGTNAVNGIYQLSGNGLYLTSNSIRVTCGTETQNWTLGSKKALTFSNGMTFAFSYTADGLFLTVSDSTNTADTEAPVLGEDFTWTSYDEGLNTDVTVFWNAATDNTGIAEYRLRYGDTDVLSGNGFRVANTEYTFFNMPDCNCYYQVKAIDYAGNESDWSRVLSFTVDSDNSSVTIDGIPQVEYMYGCMPTAIGIVLAYYDRKGYLGYDVSRLFDGTAELNSRGLDGDRFDMDAFDTIVGSAIASRSHVERFVDTPAESQYEYTFTSDGTLTLNTDVWDSLADYIGTGHLWRGAGGSLATSSAVNLTLGDVQNSKYTIDVGYDGTEITIPYKYSIDLYGLNLLMEKLGYQIDTELTKNMSVDTAGGTFTYEDYKAEIDAGRLVILQINGHAMVGYGYDDETKEVIFDDCYDQGRRMIWGGTYYYSGVEREVTSVMTLVLKTDDLNLRHDTDVNNGESVMEQNIDAGEHLNVQDGGTATGSSIFADGYLDVLAGATARDTVVSSGGYMYAYKGAMLGGTLTVESGAHVKMFEGAGYTFDISALHQRAVRSGEQALIQNWNGIIGGNLANYQLILSEDIRYSRYELASEAWGFNGTVAVYDYDGSYLGDLKVNDTDILEKDELQYSLQLGEDNMLFLAVQVIDAPIITLATSSRIEWTGKSSLSIISFDTESGPVQMAVSDGHLDLYGTPDSTFAVRVRDAGSKAWSLESIVTETSASEEPQVFKAETNGVEDVFFARNASVWEAGNQVRHRGVAGVWEGTRERVELNGKNKITDIFYGGNDPSVLFLSDDANGDALLLDDIYSDAPLSVWTARVNSLKEIIAGAGDDILDMTSQRFSFGNGERITFRGGDGDDVIWANVGDNWLFGDSGDDKLVGATGNDVIVGGIGNDVMNGGGGNDVFCFCDGWGNDSVSQIADGQVTLWFTPGTELEISEDKHTIGDGAGNTILLTGDWTTDDVILCVGDEQLTNTELLPHPCENYATLSANGAFDAYTSQRIFG